MVYVMRQKEEIDADEVKRKIIGMICPCGFTLALFSLFILHAPLTRIYLSGVVFDALVCYRCIFVYFVVICCILFTLEGQKYIALDYTWISWEAPQY